MTDEVPITQLLLTVSFEPSVGTLNVLQLADLYKQFQSEFPQFAQVQPAGPMTYKIETLPEVPSTGLPRLQFLTADSSKFILFQEDRFSFGWFRQSPLDEPANYPGFEALAQEALSRWSTARSWLAENVGLVVKPAVGEVLYSDAFETHGQDNVPIPLSSNFSFLNSVGSKMLSFEHKWVEPLPEEEGIAVVNIQGPALTVYGRPVATMTSSANFKAADDWDNLAPQIENVRQALGEIFKRLVKRPIDTKLQGS